MRSVAEIRRTRLSEAMREAELDALVLFGNAWQNDYLRYAADFGILEGEGLAVVRRDGDTVLYLDDRLEAERAGVECPDLDVVASDDVVADVAAFLGRVENARVALGPKRHMPHGVARAATSATTEDATALIDRLLMVKAEEELAAVRRAARLADGLRGLSSGRGGGERGLRARGRN